MCNCIQTINKLLVDNDLNAKIQTPNILNGKLKNVGVNRTIVTLTKIDPSKRTKMPEIVADNCPFCGETYD